MIKHIVIFILVSTGHLFPQLKDSLNIINDSTVTKPDSTTSVADTSRTNKPDSIAVQESIVPIQMEPLTETSFIISRKEFLFSDYRYSGDFLKQFPLTFTQDLGFIGYPNQSFIYGIGNSGVSYLIDGVFWNDRFSNSLDLNLVQSEDIDSIEIVPLPRGFLYGPFNNAATVNFITRDFVSQAPYSRIKYYEGPDGEAMIDGKFNAQVMKRLNFSFEVTNRGKDSVYSNTAFSLWQANAKLKYFLSNSFNLAVDYRFNHLRRGLNDGVNIDSAQQISSDVNSILYYPLQAPVNSPFQKQEILQNIIVLKTLAKPFDNSNLNVSFYYQHSLDETKDFKDSTRNSFNNNEKVYGGALDFTQRVEAVSFQILSSFERENNFTKNETYQGKSLFQDDYSRLYNHFSLGGIFTLFLLDDDLQSSIFLKHENLSANDFSYSNFGEGIDLKYKLFDFLHFYTGISKYEISGIHDLNDFEAGAYYKNSNLVLNLKYFHLENYLNFIAGPDIPRDLSTEKIKGLGLTFNWNFWLLLLETNTTYYNSQKDVMLKNLPDWNFAGGIYLNNYYFDNNLKLKVGFKFFYNGKINFFNTYYGFTSMVDPSNKLDFNLIGEIKERAIVYFTWENLFNNQYYVTPYYPMPERNIRFGIAWELFN
jgi:outer membrane cobalamin receptor